ncbi:hypothetical protein SLE2022_119660 [Rubroshorea leprosula]
MEGESFVVLYLGKDQGPPDRIGATRSTLHGGWGRHQLFSVPRLSLFNHLLFLLFQGPLFSPSLPILTGMYPQQIAVLTASQERTVPCEFPAIGIAGACILISHVSHHLSPPRQDQGYSSEQDPEEEPCMAS